MRILFSLFLLFATNHFSFSISGEVIIKGTAPGNKGENLIEVFKLSDPITKQIATLCLVKPDSKGRFTASFECENVLKITIRHGVHDMSMYVEGGMVYEITLPAFKDLNVQQKQNPFFEQYKIHLDIPGNPDLNSRIKQFDSVYLRSEKLITENIFLREPWINYDSVIFSLKSLIQDFDHSYYTRYTRYRTTLLMMIPEKDYRSRMQMARILNEEFDISNTAYVDMVSKVFGNYLEFLSSGEYGADLKMSIDIKPSVRVILEIMKSEGIIENDRLMEYILLENLYNSYYDSEFSKDRLYQLINWMSLNARFEFNRDLASIFISKFDRLRKGYRPPDFRLEDEKGIPFTLDSLSGKYVILSFGRSDSWITDSEYGVLNSWCKQYLEDLYVVSILSDIDFTRAATKYRDLGIEWIILNGSSSRNLERAYDIRYIPSFYFLNREGKSIQAPSSMPSENLRQLFLRYLQDDLLDDLRK